MINLFLYTSEMALSAASSVSLSDAAILSFIQFSVHPSLKMIPCLIAFLFSDFVFHKSLLHAKMSKSSMLKISFPSNLTASFLKIALPILLADVFFVSTFDSSLMSKLKFAVPGIMTSLLPKFGNLTNNNWFWSISLGLWVTITFWREPFTPRAFRI